MTFKLLQKGIKGSKLPEKTVRISQRSISFSRDLRESFEKRYGLEIYMDEEEKKIGFMLSEDTIKAYKLNRYKSIPKISHLFKKYPNIVNKSYKAIIDGNMIVIDLRK